LEDVDIGIRTGADLGPGLQPGARPKNCGSKFHKNMIKRPVSPIAHPDVRIAQQPSTLALAGGRAQCLFGDSPLLATRRGRR
jgi:hypothetical protein